MRDWLLLYFGETRLSGEPLSDTLLPDGRRRLNRDLILEQNDQRIVCPKGKVTDYSSTPRVWLVWFLAFLGLWLVSQGYLWGPLVSLLRLIVPIRENTTYGGIQHDCQTDNIPITNPVVWLKTALRAARGWAGTCLSGAPRAKAWQIVPCWIGLSTVGLIPVGYKNIKQHFSDSQ